MNEQDGRAAEEGAFRRVIENVAAGIVVLQDERIAFVNARATRLLGRDAAALVGIDPATLLPEEERGRPAESYRSLVEGRAEEDYSEYRVTLPDGRVRHLAVSATRTEWHGRPAMLGVLHDISRQRAAMTALRGSEERYRTMIESLSEGVGDDGGVAGVGDDQEAVLADSVDDQVIDDPAVGGAHHRVLGATDGQARRVGDERRRERLAGLGAFDEEFAHVGQVE